MFLLLNCFFIIIIHFFIKIFFNYKKITYKKLCYVYIITFLIFVIFAFNNYFLNLDLLNELNYLYLIINILIFFSYLLTIGLKSIDSPTLHIIDFLRENKNTNLNELENFLIEKKILQIRFQKLQEEKLIILNDKSMEITKSGKAFSSFMKFLANLYKIKTEG